MSNVRQWVCEMVLTARRQMLQQSFLLYALLLATGALAQAAEQGVTILNELAILEEWSGEDMAQYLGRSYRATLEYLSQCRKVLRTYLQRWCGDEPQITQAH